MISMVEGASRQKTPNETALGILLVALTIVFLAVVLSLPAMAGYIEDSARALGFRAEGRISLPILVSLLACLIPTTIGGLLSAVGISGIDRPDSGRVVLGGQDITGQPGHISYMLQKDLLLPYKKIIDNVSLPLLLSGKSKKEARAEAGSHFAQFGLEGTQQQYPAELSGGMRQRAALLRTYLAGDRVALLDEPFSALDTITKSAMHRWYLSVMEEIKLSTIFITHDIDEAVLLSDRILILSGRPGKITHQITIAEPKPRRRDFNLTPEFLDYKKQVIDALGVVL